MYQQSKDCSFTEKEFSALTKAFEKHIFNGLDSVSVQLDMEKTYVPNHACAWNKVKKIGKPCKILQKNDKLCLVLFKNHYVFGEISENLYRIEDLSVID